MELREFAHEGRTFRYVDQSLMLPKSAVAGMLATLEKWRSAYPPENTYAYRTWRVPGVIVRFDGVLSPRGEFESYELQSGCGWVGYAALANGAFREVRDDFLKNTWPAFSLLAPPGPLHNPDELLWMKRINMQTAATGEDLLWVRYGARQLHPDIRERLIARSVKPVGTHNSKRYGEALGWWSEVADAGALPWDKPFALKPNQSFGSKDIMLWLPDERRGRSTRSQIEQTLSRRGAMFLQRYIAPMRIEISGIPYHVILRPFFGYDPRSNSWTPMHGVWTGRPAPNLRIHGASDAISGPLLIGEDE